MKNTRCVRVAGIVGMFGAVLWLIALFIEYAYGLFSPGGGTLYVANQAMFLVAQLCYLGVIVGLIRARAAGERWLGRLPLWLFFVGWAALATALLASILGLSGISDGPSGDVLFLLGAIASTLGGLLAGIAVAVVGRLPGLWPFAPLVQGLYQLVAFLRAALADQEPTQLTESLWTGTWFLMGLALFVSVRKARPAAGHEIHEPRKAVKA